jgi:hypothetical protein
MGWGGGKIGGFLSQVGYVLDLRNLRVSDGARGSVGLSKFKISGNSHGRSL